MMMLLALLRQGGIGLRLRNLDGHAAVGGFTAQFREQYSHSHTHSGDDDGDSGGDDDGDSGGGGGRQTDPWPQTGKKRGRTMTAADIRLHDVIVAVGSLDVLSPRLCSFDKVRDPLRLAEIATTAWGLGSMCYASSPAVLLLCCCCAVVVALCCFDAVVVLLLLLCCGCAVAVLLLVLLLYCAVAVYAVQRRAVSVTLTLCTALPAASHVVLCA